MAILDPGTYDKARPLIISAVRNSLEPGDDWLNAMGPIMAALREQGLSPEAVAPMAVYVSFFIEEMQKGRVDPFAASSAADGTIFPGQALPQQELFGSETHGGSEADRALIEQLIAATQLYDSAQSIKDLLDFTIRLRAFAPFNAMLLHIQKPGLTHAATARDWLHRFGRVPKRGARPLLVLRTMGPVDFVFDLLDTDGPSLPIDAFAFPTLGELSAEEFNRLVQSLTRQGISLAPIDAGDAMAGWIRVLARSHSKGKHIYEIAYNRNHSTATRFVTVAHELAHLFLGHLGADAGRRVPDRCNTPHDLREIEAEMAAYLVAMRNGLKPRSESYLARYKGAFSDLNLYAVMRAANAVETAMGIGAQKLWKAKEQGVEYESEARPAKHADA